MMYPAPKHKQRRLQLAGRFRSHYAHSYAMCRCSVTLDNAKQCLQLVLLDYTTADSWCACRTTPSL